MAIRSLFPPRLVFYALLTLVTLSAGTVSERTIDDASGDSVSGLLPVYTPVNGFSSNTDCSTCVIHPDPANAFGGTWHDGSQLPGGPAVSVSLSFTGTAISLFCILVNTANLADITISDFSFILDGASRGTFTHVPDNTSDFIYNAKVFSVDGLDRTNHTVVLTTDNPAGSLALFDYASYTFDDGISPSTSVTATGGADTGATTSTTRNTVSVNSHSSGASESQTVTTSNASASLASTSSPTTISSTGPNRSADPITTSTAPSASITVSASKKNKLAPILAGTLIPVFLIALAGIIICLYRRHRSRRQVEFEQTRVRPPSAEWVQLSESPATAGASLPGTRRFSVEHNNRSPIQEKSSHFVDEISPTSPPSVRSEPTLSRAPTFRTFDYVTTSPPHYSATFQPEQLIQFGNISRSGQADHV
ncbi:hypothetical protein FB451DRAFT_1138868 [Mycena latifolia]|nr:hypothetical protein FB451DRAFT_1138868 [Mycena latifolia]